MRTEEEISHHRSSSVLVLSGAWLICADLHWDQGIAAAVMPAAAFCCANRQKEMKTYGYRRLRSTSAARDTATERSEDAADASLCNHAG